MTDFPRQSRLPRSLDTARNRYRAVAEKYLGPTVETPAVAVLPVPSRPAPEAPPSARRLVPIPDGIDPRRPSTWPAYLRDRARVVRAQYGDAAALAEARAELAWLAGDARREGWLLLEPPVGGEPEPPADLPEDLRRWPPGPRYAVAALERRGASRPEAVARVRAGEPTPTPAGPGLPADRRRWPEDAAATFWQLVKDLNRDARDRNCARDGRSPWALEDAERAIRETWRNPLPLGGAA